METRRQRALVPCVGHIEVSKFLKTCRRGLHSIENPFYDQTVNGSCRKCSNALMREWKRKAGQVEHSRIAEQLPPINTNICGAGLHDMTDPNNVQSNGQWRRCKICKTEKEQKRRAKIRRLNSYINSDTSRGYYGPTKGVWRGKKSGEMGDVIQEGPTVMQFEQTNG